jgi:hypothetical protein
MAGSSAVDGSGVDFFPFGSAAVVSSAFACSVLLWTMMKDILVDSFLVV